MVNIERDIDRIQELYRRFHFKCRTCKAPLPFDEATTDKHIATWLVGSKTIPPTTQISTLKCECGASTCVGCGNEPVIHHDRSFWTPLGVVNHCCDDGRLWGIWLILLRFDGQVVKLKEENKAAPPRCVSLSATILCLLSSSNIYLFLDITVFTCSSPIQSSLTNVL